MQKRQSDGDLAQQGTARDGVSPGRDATIALVFGVDLKEIGRASCRERVFLLV